MGNNYLVSYKRQISLLCFIFCFNSIVLALDSLDKSLIKVSNYNGLYTINSKIVHLGIDKKKKILIFKNKNQTLKVFKNKKNEKILVYSRVLNKYIENVYLKKKSKTNYFVKYEKFKNNQYFFTEHLNCSYQNIQKINFENLQEVIEKTNFENIFDKKNCSDISNDKLNKFQDLFSENISASNSYLKECLRNSSFQKYLDDNENFSSNILLLLQSYEQHISNLKNGEKSFEIKCEENNNQENKVASVQLNEGMTKLFLFKKKGELEILNGDASTVLNHEFFHMSSQKLNVDGTHACVEEENAKLFTKICNKIVYETAGRFDLSKEKITNDNEIFLECKKNTKPSEANQLSLRTVETNANVALPKVTSQTEEAITANGRSANISSEQRIAMAPEPQHLIEVANSEVDRIIASLPATTENSQQRSVASIPGLSELLTSAGAAMSSIGNAIVDTSAAAAVAVVAVRGSNSSNSSAITYPTANLAADIFNSGAPIAGYSPVETNNPIATNNKDIKSGSINAVNHQSVVENVEKRAIPNSVNQQVLNARSSTENQNLTENNNSQTIKPSLMTRSQRGIASIKGLEAGEKNVKKSTKPNSTVDEPSVVTSTDQTSQSVKTNEINANIENKIFNNLGRIGKISGSSYFNFKQFLSKKNSNQEIKQRKIYIYNENGSTVAGVKDQAKFCFVDLKSQNQFIKEDCNNTNKR